MGNSNALIEELINDDRYIIWPDGIISTQVKAKGKGLGEWRDVYINIDNQSYHRIKYQKRMIRLHRIIFRAFKGKLRSNLVINHIDNNRGNNHISNLEQVTQSTNVKQIYRSA